MSRCSLLFLTRWIVYAAALILAAPAAFPQTPVLTYHNDKARTGLNPVESLLTPANVNTAGFGKNFSLTVDGQVYAQPLYVPNFFIPGKGSHNTVFVATEHDSLYAFDSDANGSPLWQRSFLSTNVTSIPSSQTNCGQITPEIGITATPVINRASRTMYVVVSTQEGAQTVHRLHAISIETGNDVRTPVVITATAKNVMGQTITFDPAAQKARPGLLLLNGTVYTSWGSHCDRGTYYGWLIGYDESTLAQRVAFNVAPDKAQAALWNSGAGPASDGQYIYFETSNGDFDASQGDLDYGDSFVKYDPQAQIVAGYYTPPNQASLSSADLDVGSGGLLLLPDSAGSSAHPHLMIGAGKNGAVYLVDRDDPGGYNTGAAPVETNNAIVSSFGMPAYFNGAVYFGGNGDYIKRFVISNAAYNQTPASQSANSYAYPGATPSISADGTNNGIVWTIEGKSGNAILHAYNASDLGEELYNSNQNVARDAAGGYVKYSVPTVADGKVFVGGSSTLSVYTLVGNGCAADASGSTSVSTGHLRYDLASHSFIESVTISNTSQQTLSAPVTLVVAQMPNRLALLNATGTASCRLNAGAPYINLAGDLPAGQSATVQLEFSSPERLAAFFTPRVVAGAGSR